MRWLAVARVDESPVHVVTRAAIGADGTRVYRAALSRRRHAQCAVDLYVMRARRQRAGQGRSRRAIPTSIWPGSTGRGRRRACSSSARAATRRRLDLLSVDPATGRSTLLFSETSHDLDQPHTTISSRCGRQPDLVAPSGPASRISTAANAGAGRSSPMATGRWRRSPASTSSATGSISPATRRRRSSGSSTGSTIAIPARRRSGDRDRLVERRGDGRGRDPRPDHPLQSRPAAPGLSRRRGRPAPRLDRGEPARRVASLCALSRRPCRSRASARSARPDGTELHYRMLVAAARAGPALSGLRPRLWRARHGAAGDPRLVQLPIQQYLVQHGWIVFSLDNRGTARSRHAVRGRHLPRHGRGRGRRTSSPASHWLKQPALRRSARRSP